ncbi:hypothetical protein HN587_04450 [Candidatus Woesearchaeota archaeon]|jgi:hypothetical protein|nr:hypothetical protein [Candidatus Woesearchaeota archaeon]
MKAEFEGETFKQLKSGIYVPKEYHFELEHPVLSKAVNLGKNTLALGLATIVLATATPVLADQPVPDQGVPTDDAAQVEMVAEEAPKPNDVFGGTLVSKSGGVDTLVMYGHENGAVINAESKNPIWDEAPIHLFSLGLKSPTFGNDLFRVATATDLAHDLSSWGYTAFLEAFPTKGLTLRSGAFQAGSDSSTDILGGFIGAKFAMDFLTLDADVWYDGTQFNGHGFVSGAIPLANSGHLYLSAGGDIEQRTLNTLTGWINPGSVGIFNKVSVDFDDHVQSGCFMIADQSTYKKGSYDFKQHVFNGTGMRMVATGHILDGWAPFSAHHTENISFAVNWANSDDAVSASGMFYFRPNSSVFVGIGAGDSFDKVTGDHSPIARAELYAKIYGPLEAWIDLPINLETGAMTPMLYVGASKSF